jgi:hypothetical protein
MQSETPLRSPHLQECSAVGLDLVSKGYKLLGDGDSENFLHK